MNKQCTVHIFSIKQRQYLILLTTKSPTGVYQLYTTYTYQPQNQSQKACKMVYQPFRNGSTSNYN